MAWKLATFNVNGIRARLPLILGWMAKSRPDVLCLQEIKCREDDFPAEPFLELGYQVTIRGQKSFNGVAILSKALPSETILGFSDGLPDDEARLLSVRMDDVWVVNTYVPQGRSPEDPAFQQKLDFLARLKRWFAEHFQPTVPIVWVGDMNVAPRSMDVFDPKRMEGKIACHPAEREALETVISWGFTDIFRYLHPSSVQYTFWDYRLPKSFERNLGWRIDHILATAPLIPILLDCTVDTEPRGLEKPSDHTPVVAWFNRG